MFILQCLTTWHAHKKRYYTYSRYTYLTQNYPFQYVKLQNYTKMTSSTSQFMDKTVLKYTSTGHRSPGPAAYHVKPTIGTGSTDPTIEKNPAYSIQGRRTKDVSTVEGLINS